MLSRAGEHELPAERIDLADAADRAAGRWQRAADAKRIRLLRRSGAGSTVSAAAADLDRALDSLIENAIVYSPTGSEVEIVDGPGAIAVRDRGPGLAPGEEEAVLDRFFRGRAGRQGPEGTGLGLAIAASSPASGEAASRWRIAPAAAPRRGSRFPSSIARPRGALVSTRAASILRWSLLALAGLAVAIGVGVAAAALTSNQIGLSEEPIRAGEALAPSSARDDHSGGRGRDHPEDGPHHGGHDDSSTGTTTTTTPTTTVPPATTTTAPPATTPPTSTSDDSSGQGDGDDD